MNPLISALFALLVYQCVCRARRQVYDETVGRPLTPTIARSKTFQGRYFNVRIHDEYTMIIRFEGETTDRIYADTAATWHLHQFRNTTLCCFDKQGKPVYASVLEPRPLLVTPA